LWFQSSESPVISFAQASKNVKKALTLGDQDWVAYLALCELHLMRKEHDKAIAAAERAIALNPSAAFAYAELGAVLTFSGRAEEGIAMTQKSMRLNPFPEAYQLTYLGFAYYFLGRYEDAIEVYNKALKRSADDLFAHIWLTAAYMALGREEEARHQAEVLLRLDPTFSLEQLDEILPIRDKTEAERFIADLRKAGLK
jgi:adenylate cyclase